MYGCMWVGLYMYVCVGVGMVCVYRYVDVCGYVCVCVLWGVYIVCVVVLLPVSAVVVCRRR